MRIVHGLPAADAPLPGPELALGNVVKLKKPYRVREGGRAGDFAYGIIAEHVGRNAAGHPLVALFLYEADGRLLLGPHGIPQFEDCCASEFVLWKVAAESGYLVANHPHGHDLYPTCPACGDRDQHPFKKGGACVRCGGWGHSPDMQRLASGAAGQGHAGEVGEGS
jgi:hypothetical protein